MTTPDDDLTPAKALRILIDIDRRERARDERRARIRARIKAVAGWLVNPFRQKVRAR